MPVKLAKPDPATLLPVAGVRLGIAQAGVRKANRKDLLLVALDEGAVAAAVFTRNRFCAAPVHVARAHLAAGAGIRALVVNTGCANAGTGEPGMVAARAVCARVGELLGVAADRVLPYSTGVIMEALPVERITAGLPACIAALGPDRWADAAEAIMTTDTLPKAASATAQVDGVQVTLTGISKGAGMIHPNMATMLGFVATDVALDPAYAREAVRRAADASFNRITIDGDTSTNDALTLVATGRAGNAPLVDPDSPGARAFQEALNALCVTLAQAIVRDGEGATKFITVRVEGGRDEAECRKAAYAVAHSPLVKTAFYASDPNLGRILAAVGYAGIDDLDVAGVSLWLGEVLVVSGGGRSPDYVEADASRVMAEAEILVRVDLGRGDAATEVWTCDLSHDYVSINADYRS